MSGRGANIATTRIFRRACVAETSRSATRHSHSASCMKLAVPVRMRGYRHPSSAIRVFPCSLSKVCTYLCWAADGAGRGGLTVAWLWPELCVAWCVNPWTMAADCRAMCEADCLPLHTLL